MHYQPIAAANNAEFHHRLAIGWAVEATCEAQGAKVSDPLGSEHLPGQHGYLIKEPGVKAMDRFVPLDRLQDQPEPDGAPALGAGKRIDGIDHLSLIRRAACLATEAGHNLYDQRVGGQAF